MSGETSQAGSERRDFGVRPTGENRRCSPVLSDAVFEPLRFGHKEGSV
jgi:hypothetical protein